jgi:hypothetical protein
MSDLFPKGTGCIIAIGIAKWVILILAVGIFIGWLIWH